MNSFGVIVTPTLIIGGYGRAGKDTAAEFFRDNTVLRYAGGSSWAARHYMAERLSEKLGRLVTPDEAFASRHEGGDETRMFWYTEMNKFREGDWTRLVRLCLEESDIVCGLRDKREIVEAKKQNLVDLIIWIDNPRVPVDKTTTYTSDDTDIIIRNAGTIEEYHEKLRRFSQALGLNIIN